MAVILLYTVLIVTITCCLIVDIFAAFVIFGNASQLSSDKLTNK